MWHPVLAALDWIRGNMDDGCRFVPMQDVPIDEVIPAKWRSSVIDGEGRVSRISYELCVLTAIRSELERELLLLNASIPSNDKVRLLWCGENRISITPFKPAPEPKGLDAIKGEIGGRWPMTGLLDVLKEAALDTGLLDAFETSASRVEMPAIGTDVVIESALSGAMICSRMVLVRDTDGGDSIKKTAGCHGSIRTADFCT